MSRNEDMGKEKLLDLAKVQAIIRKNWIVLKNDPTRLTMMLIFPVIMITLLGYTSGVAPKHLTAALVDYDQTLLSGQVMQQLYALPILTIRKQVGTDSEGKKLLDQGLVKALIVIPKGFEESVRKGKASKLRILVDESDPTVAQIAKESVKVFVKTLSLSAASVQISQTQAEMAHAEATLASLESVLSASTDESTFRAALQSLTLAQTRLKQSSDTLVRTTQTLSQSLSNPTTPDYLAQAPLLTDDASRASVVQSILSQQQALNQMAATLALSGVNHKALVQIRYAQAAISTQYAQSKAQESKSAQKKAAVESARQTLFAFSEKDPNVLVEPISLEEVPVYGRNRQGIDFLLPSILALIIFQGATMGMGRAIAGERKNGSLTRVFLTPTSNFTILVGTQLFYLLFESIRSTFIVLLAMALFNVHIAGNFLEILFLIMLFSTGAIGVGLFLSTLAKDEDQYQPMAMIISLPMMFLAGVFFPIQTMPAPLQALATVIPIYPASNALRGVMIKGFGLLQVLPDIAYLVVFAAITFVASLIVFKREVL